MNARSINRKVTVAQNSGEVVYITDCGFDFTKNGLYGATRVWKFTGYLTGKVNKRVRYGLCSYSVRRNYNFLIQISIPFTSPRKVINRPRFDVKIMKAKTTNEKTWTFKPMEHAKE